MSDDDLHSLAESLAFVARDLGIARPSDVARLVQQWEALVGDALAQHTRPAHIRDEVLTIEVDDNAWGSPLRYLHDELIARANAILGGAPLREVRIVVRGSQTPRTSRPIRPVPGEK